jgi:hypothetical protein
MRTKEKKFKRGDKVRLNEEGMQAVINEQTQITFEMREPYMEHADPDDPHPWPYKDEYEAVDFSGLKHWLGILTKHSKYGWEFRDHEGRIYIHHVAETGLELFVTSPLIEWLRRAR